MEWEELFGRLESAIRDHPNADQTTAHRMLVKNSLSHLGSIREAVLAMSDGAFVCALCDKVRPGSEWNYSNGSCNECAGQ